MAQLGNTIINGNLRANGTISTPSLTVNNKAVESLAGAIADSTTSTNLVSASQIVDYISTTSGVLNDLSASWNSTTHKYTVSGGVSQTGWVNLSTAQTALEINGSAIGSDYIDAKTIGPGSSIVLTAGYYPNARTISASIADVDVESRAASGLTFVLSSLTGSSAVAVGTLSSGYYPIVASGLSVTGTVSAATSGWFSSASLTDSTSNDNLTVGKIIAASGSISGGAPSTTAPSTTFSTAESSGDLIVTATSRTTPSSAAISTSTTAGYTPASSSYATKSAQTGSVVSSSSNTTIPAATFTTTSSSAVCHTAGYISANKTVLNVGIASAPVLSLTDQSATEITIGTLSAGKYPLSTSLSGNVNIASAGYISAGNKVVSDSSVAVGYINELSATSVAVGSTEIPILTFGYGYEAKLSAGYTPGGYIRSTIGAATFSTSVSGPTVTVNCGTAGYTGATLVGSGTVSNGAYHSTVLSNGGNDFTPIIGAFGSAGTDYNVSIGTITTTKPTSGYYMAMSSGSQTSKTITAGAEITTSGYLTAGSTTSELNINLLSSGAYYIPITSGTYTAAISSGGSFTPSIASDGASSNISISSATSTLPSSGYYIGVHSVSGTSRQITATANVGTTGYIAASTKTSSTSVAINSSGTYYIPVTAGVYAAGIGFSSSTNSISATNATIGTSQASGIKIDASASVSATATASISTAGHIPTGSKTASSTSTPNTETYILGVSVGSGKSFSVANAGSTTISTNSGTLGITSNTGTVSIAANTGNVNYLGNWLITKDASNNLTFTYSA